MINVVNSALQKILNDYREVTQSQRDSGTLFEELMIEYFKHEPKFKSEYETVLTYADWAEKYADELNIPHKKDAGIDLVATNYSGEHHAIQCKNYVPSHKMAKSDIDSFMGASGKTYFSYRIIISTVTNWTDNATEMLENQTPPVSTINLSELEQSVIDWDLYYKDHEVKTVEKYDLRPHQQRSHDGVINGLATADRGKLILACGTGKTFTSLRIAETMAGKGKKVLFLVPSLALLSQTLNEWTQQAKLPLRNFAVCSDSDVGKTKVSEDDRVIATRSELDFPSTTNAKSLADAIKTRHDDDHMTVVYSTYHSINVLSDAQMSHNIGEFDLIICDEAHRTTGATFTDEDESNFVMVHSNDNIMAKKRLYMTATPRIYSEDAKATEAVELCSMDDEALFGKELYVINFSTAVSLGLLVDYKVIVLSVEESVINRRLQKLLQDDDNQLNVNDAAKIIGCWKALSKQGLEGHGDPMQRAVAFCQVINTDYKGTKHKVSSKLISSMFSDVVEAYQTAEISALLAEDPNAVIPASLSLSCKSKHVDGSMNASKKQEKLDWLKQDLEDNTCHILSNVRCLSEGVDVPALDAVMFMTPRQSQVDVVQSVGRVMRKAPGKTQGYVILPVVVPAGMEPSDALNDNQIYKVVWQVLNALRSHDDSFDAMINKLEFNGRDNSKMEVIAITDKVQKKTSSSGGKVKGQGKGHGIGGKDTGGDPAPEQMTMDFEVGEIERALYAKVVKKCGNRHHWEDWANDISKIANTHIDRIKAILEDDQYEKETKLFNSFANELRDDLNSSISDEEVIEMLAQHLITKPVFDALFEEYEFAKKNPISVAMQELLDVMQAHNLDKEAKTLESFYDSVKMRASGIHSAEGKQRIILELYDKFFKNAFPRITERLGIVYTPTEVVDFIIHSIENVLNDEFDSSLADENVHIIDPFTGTGTFVTRLLQSGIIPNDKLAHKYKHEIHANEIVLLAYYIACINIETVYHSVMIGDTTDNSKSNEIGYEPFEGICLTDTFEMYEKEDLISELLEDNSERRKRQKALDIRVIMGNPPYSSGQSSENDNNKNVAYSSLDKRISDTYAANSTAILQKNLYDSYIRAIRWASDRIGNKGVIGFVTNAGFIEGSTSDGLRKCLAQEFSHLYIFHLRGNARTSGERRRKERDNVFGQGTRTPIAITILVKNPESKVIGQIKTHDIGDYLTREQKLEVITNYKDLNGITNAKRWQGIIPDEFNDWVGQRDPNFDNYIQLGDKKNKNAKVIFGNYTLGVVTNRDAWAYNFSKSSLRENFSNMIAFYQRELERNAPKMIENIELDVGDYIDNDTTKISWTRAIKKDFKNNIKHSYDDNCLIKSLYRPFTKTNMYYSRVWNEMVYQMPKVFPSSIVSNRLFSVTGIGSTKDFSVIITDTLPDIQLISNGQCYPLYLYEKIENDQIDTADLLSDLEDESFTDDNIIVDDDGKPIYRRKDAITDEGLAHFIDYYVEAASECNISKESLFYYIYGLLHSEDYRERYTESLTKQLPNIPRVKAYEDFIAFSKAGRQLADIHINYENVDMYQGVKIISKLTNLKLADGQNWAKSNIEDSSFYVTKMKYAKRKNEETGKNEDDPTKIIYNNHITVENIPEEAYDYVVNGKPAIDWIMERQSVKTDKKTEITNDANDWAIETMGNARYPLELLLRVINVSLKTQEIVNGLPELVLE